MIGYPDEDPSPRLRGKAQSRKKSGKNSSFPKSDLPRNIKNAEGRNTDSFYYVEQTDHHHSLISDQHYQDNTPDVIESTQYLKPESRRLLPDLSWGKRFPDPINGNMDGCEDIRLPPKQADGFRKSPHEPYSSDRTRTSPKTDPSRYFPRGQVPLPEPLVFNEQKMHVTPVETSLLLTPDSPDDSRYYSNRSLNNNTVISNRERRPHKTPHTDGTRPFLPKRVLDDLGCADRPDIHNALEIMKDGETLLMVEHSRWMTRTVNTECRLEPDMLHISYIRRRCWMPKIQCGRTRRSFDIRDVMMARSGRDGILRVIETDLPEDRCFSLVFDSGMKKTLNFLAQTTESAKDWVKGINYMKKRVQALLPRLKRELYYWEIFTKSDKNGDSKIMWGEIVTMFRNMGATCTSQDKKKIVEIFKRHDKDKDYSLNFEEFISFHEEATLRGEICNIFRKYSPDDEFLTARELYKFIQDSQREYDVTEADCFKIIDDYEMNEDNRALKKMSVHGFSTFLMSPSCDVFNKRHDEVYQDMKQPLSHYFIASSHNTYLTGDQLKDPSSTDAYMKVLRQGCRCVELDCWDGPDDEPVIYHGYTLTSKIKFKDAIEVIGKHAFEASSFPLILSIENHCSLPQQEKMATYMRQILGAELLTDCVINENDEVHLPSPAALQGKILVKGKKLPPVQDYDDDAGDVSDEDEAAEMERVIHGKKDEKRNNHVAFNKRQVTSANEVSTSEDYDGRTTAFVNPSSVYAKPTTRSNSVTLSGSNQSSMKTKAQEKKLKLSQNLSDQVVYCKSAKFKGIDEGMRITTFKEISSFTENKAYKLASNQNSGAIKFHSRHLNRTYPGATRTDSSNYDPQPLWNAGFQVVALNYQTKCDEMTLYNAKFRQNGGCGYVLKPSFMTSVDDDVISRKEDPKKMHITVISGSYLPVQATSSDNYFCVEVSISGDGKDAASHKTKPTRSNGYNPVWGEKKSFHVLVPSMAMVWFKVTNEDGDMVGQFVLPFSSISQGYRAVHLMDRSGIPLRGSYLLVQITVDDVTN